MGKSLVMVFVDCRDVARPERARVGEGEDVFQCLDICDDFLSIHSHGSIAVRCSQPSENSGLLCDQTERPTSVPLGMAVERHSDL